MGYKIHALKNPIKLREIEPIGFGQISHREMTTLKYFEYFNNVKSCKYCAKK